MRKPGVAAVFAGLIITGGSAQAAQCGDSAKGFGGFIKAFEQDAASQGIGKRGLSALDGVAYDPAIIKKDRAQSIFSQDFLEFQARMVSDYRIKQGAVLLKKHKSVFDAVEKEYDETAVDFDGDGHRNLRRSIPDAMASSAALLIKHGWQPGQPWLREVRVPKDLPWDQADIAIKHPRKQWVKWGVKPTSGKLAADNFPASLLLPMGKDGPAFLAYENFTTAYLKWNESLIYSTTAAYLATRIEGAKKVLPGNAKVNELTFEQIIELQNLLVGLGYDVGDVDGKIGRATRAAVREVQIKLGVAADSYPTVEFLKHLKRS
jgi:membrane-bound lytic murein transglycosylase B